MALLKSLFAKNAGDISVSSRHKNIVKKINDLEEDFVALEDSALRQKTAEFRKKIQDGENIEDILPHAFALVREAARRTLGQRHFDVQLFGGLVLHEGGIAEMKTGEGKTLVATLAAYVNALKGNGVHVVTVNDYLSRRDAVWMGQVYDFLGLSVGVINHDTSFIYDSQVEGDKDKERDIHGSFHVVYDFLRSCTRKEAYACDITYGTNSEFGFDHLRDNLAYTEERLVQRKHNYAIVDEIDSILIDEARTPLIISAPITEKESLYPRFAQIAKTLGKDVDYTVDEKLRAITLSDPGIEKAEHALGVGNIYTEGGIKYVHHLETAVRAQALFERDRDYVVKEGEVIIVDQFTGRMQPGRRWSEGLHQAIEAKEGVVIKNESRTFASITYQNYFRMYTKLSGMTGTALTSAEEFGKVYGLETKVIPTNKKSARIDNDDLIFQTESGKFAALARKIKELHKHGQPVLVGTISIEKSELLSQYLKKEGVPHEILNAKNHEREGEIIAQGGRRGAITIATNMAGRGIDIKLGGVDGKKDVYEEVKELGGLFVLGTERHEARRIDNQLRGRSGRQGDPGETQFYVSLEDTLMRVFASDKIKGMMGRFGIPEDEPIENKIVSRAIESAQTKIEGFNFDARKHVLEFDDVLNHQRKSIYQKRRDALMGDQKKLEEILLEVISGDEEEKLKNVVVEKKSKLGEEHFWELFRALVLKTIDMLWIEHQEAMDYMRGSVNLRAYGQRDPLVEYKKEGLRLFHELQTSFNEQVRRFLPYIAGGMETKEEVGDLEAIHKSAQAISGKTQGEAKGPQTLRGKDGKKVGRNDSCPCGSGKKYKKCGLLETEEHKKLTHTK